MNSALVFGVSGGLGKAFVEALSQDYETVYAVSREGYVFPQSNVISFVGDVTNEESLLSVASEIANPIQLVIVATGILHDSSGLSPEKSLKDITKKNFELSYVVNTVGPALVGKVFGPKLDKEQKSVFAVLTARVGSISDNRLGGWYAYRAAKAATHMIVKCLAIELSRKNKNAVVLSLHPGTVDTHLSKPFQRNVPSEKLFSTEYSVNQLLNVIKNSATEQSGKVLAYNGEVIEY